MGRKTDQKNMFDQIDFIPVEEYEEMLYWDIISILKDAGYNCERDNFEFSSLVLGRKLIIDNDLPAIIKVVPNIAPWAAQPESYGVFLYLKDAVPFFFKWSTGGDYIQNYKTLSLELMKYFLESVTL